MYKRLEDSSGRSRSFVACCLGLPQRSRSAILYFILSSSACGMCGLWLDMTGRYWAVPFIPIPLPEKVIQSSSCTILLYKFVLQTGLGMGMGINGTAQLLLMRVARREWQAVRPDHPPQTKHLLGVYIPVESKTRTYHGRVGTSYLCSPCSIENRLSKFNKISDSKNMYWEVWAEGFHPYHPPFPREFAKGGLGFRV